MRRKNYHVQFTNKGYSHKGITSLVMSVCSLVWLIYAVCRTFQMGEYAERLLGGVGMLALVLQIAALVLGIRSMHEEDVFRGIPKVSVVVAVVLLVIWTAIYGLGLYDAIA